MCQTKKFPSWFEINFMNVVSGKENKKYRKFVYFQKSKIKVIFYFWINLVLIRVLYGNWGFVLTLSKPKNLN